MKQRIMWVLWPAFVVAAATEMLFFVVIDPGEMHVFGHPLELSRTATYSLFFFFFWAIGACASALSSFLERSSLALERSGLVSDEQVSGDAKRSD